RGFGRLLVAIRANEDNARAFGVRASLVKLQGYLIGGFIAGIGGAIYGHSLSSIGVSTFPASASIAVVVMTVLGGVSVLIGPVLGAIWVLGLPLLNIGNIGGVHAVRDVSFTVRAGEVVGLIGPNGAGKTTTFEILGGFTRPDTGHVLFDRRDVSYLVPEERARLGLIRSFQDAALFPTMTVKETVMLAL